jgi:hypothetical protein
MSGLSPLSDAQLLGLLRRLVPSAAPAPTVSPLAAMTDAQLMQALGATSAGAPTGGAAPAEMDAAAQAADSRDAQSDPVPGDTHGQGEPPASDRASDAISKPLSETQIGSGNQRASASADTRARSGGTRRVAGVAGSRGGPANGSRLPVTRPAHLANQPARLLDARLANLRRLLLSGPAVLPLVRPPRPFR